MSWWWTTNEQMNRKKRRIFSWKKKLYCSIRILNTHTHTEFEMEQKKNLQWSNIHPRTIQITMFDSNFSNWLWLFFFVSLSLSLSLSLKHQIFLLTISHLLCFFFGKKIRKTLRYFHISMSMNVIFINIQNMIENLLYQCL